MGFLAGDKLALATPLDIFSGSANVSILHWFDSSDSTRTGSNGALGSGIRDVRDITNAAGVTPTYPWLRTNNGTSVASSSINGVSCAGLDGTIDKTFVLMSAGGSPVPTSLGGAPNGSFWTTNDTAILVFGVFSTSNTGSGPGPTFFSNSISDTLANRHIHCFRYYPDSFNSRATSFVFRGREQAVLDDTAIGQSEPFLLTFYQKTAATSKLVLSSCSRYANFGSAASGTYSAASEAGAVFRIGARPSGASFTGLLSGAIGELLVVTSSNPTGTILQSFDDPSIGDAAKKLKNYFVRKWRLKEACYINI
ncbi:MAG: hypothetical protein EBU08_09455 [Micrococcales bacterium]|nr:hypothetical protein [Micrococcales bacterium]